ncbi:ABC transporter permease, partial [Paenibacillus polymyxa]|uniref:ABC transporter permease n=2 Tax=Paenibacillus TaxID=44249 RepID=UPI0018916550
MDKNEHTVGSKHIEMKQRGPIGRGHTEGMGTGKKANDFKKNIRQLLSYIKAYMPMIILSMVLALAGSVFNVIGPDKLSDIANLIQEGIVTGIDVNAVQKIVLVLVVLYGLGLIFNYFQGFITVTVSQRLTKKMRTELSRKINHMPLKYFDATSYGNVLSRVTNDVDTIGQTLNNSLGTLVSALATFVGALIMMLYTNWIMTITGIVATLIGFSLMTVIMKHSQKYFVAQQAELGQINGHIEETYAGHNVVKVYNGEKAAKEVFHGINGRLYTNAWKSQFMSGLMMPVMMFIGN